MNAARLDPPEGYASWLDFAVETFDTRDFWIERLLADDDATKVPTREAMREAALAELRQLRSAARSGE